MWVTRLAGWLAIMLLTALFVSGCAERTSHDDYYNRPDDQAMHEMEWNLDPGR